MKVRDHYFKRESTLANADTTIIPITIKDPVSYMGIEFEATNGSGSCTDHELHDDISAIELVDGSDVLWSLDMAAARALNFYETKQWPPELATEKEGEKQEEKCTIYFGRYPDDDEFYLQPGNYANLQLRITHSLTIHADTGFATGSGKLTVMARVIEEGAKAYKGFMSAKEKISYTGSATAGDREIEMPRDMNYRMMLLKSLLTTKTHAEAISKYKLSCDADRYIPINNYTEDIVDMNKQRFGLCRQAKELWAKDAATALLDIYNIEDARIWFEADLTVAVIEQIAAEVLTLGVYTLSLSTFPVKLATEADAHAVVEGMEPYGFICIPFGDLNEPGDWFKAPDYGDIRLIATEVVTVTPACAVILQQHRL